MSRYRNRGAKWTSKDMATVLLLLGQDINCKYHARTLLVVNLADDLGRTPSAIVSCHQRLCHWLMATSTEKPIRIASAFKRYQKLLNKSRKKVDSALITWFCKKTLKNAFAKICIPIDYSKEMKEKFITAFLVKQGLTGDNSDSVTVWIASKCAVIYEEQIITVPRVEL